LMEEYTLGKVLGQGSFGVVYLCKSKASKEEFAVKMIDKVETPVEETRKEAEMLQAMEHPNVVKIHKVFYEKLFVCIVMDIYKGGDLIEGMQLHWRTKGRIPAVKVKHLTKQMADAMHHLHKNSVVHRDVKCDNYLTDRKDIVNPQCRIFLSDFGTAHRLKPGERLKTSCGTKLYWPPEFFRKNYALKVDIWAIGVVTYGLVDGRFPFKGEDDVMKKQVKLASSTPQMCTDLIQNLLHKDEDKRLDSQQLVNHAWISPDGKDAGHDEADPSHPEDKNFKADELREGGANAAVAERRRELVDRLEAAVQKVGTVKQATDLWSSQFMVQDRHTGRKATFQWWSKDKVDAEGILKVDGAQAEGNADGEKDKENIKRMLEEHNIDVSKFGVGDAKTLDQFAAEVHSGAARLMLDATKFKNMVRVVDTVLLRITHGTDAKKKTLIEVKEKYADGRTRENLNRMPGTKKEPHENTKQVAERIIKDFLNMTDCNVEFDVTKKTSYEEEDTSPSYPGVTTVYRKEIVECNVKTADAGVLKRIGLPGGNVEWNHQTSAGLKTYTWLTDKQLKQKKIELQHHEGGGISGLVQAAVGMTEEQLEVYLKENGVDPSKFGENHTRTLKEFSTELSEGESSLMKNPQGKLIRIVDVVVLLVTKEGTTDLLVEHKENYDADKESGKEGHEKILNRLPGVKRRSNENHFLAAQRILKNQIKVDENSIKLDAKSVRIIEEQKDSSSYPGLNTVYRKRLINAELLKPH